MGVTNNLKAQIDTPVWEWCRNAPGVSSALSSSCAADNSQFTVQHGRYIYYLQAATGFYRYDTISDSYQQLSSPAVAPATPFSSMSFAGGLGFFSRVISSPTSTTIQASLLTGSIFKGFDIRVIGGTGAGQQRIITAVSDVTIADSGTATAGSTSSITDTNKNWQVNQWVGYQVKIVLSTGALQTRKIIYNSATVLSWADVNKYPEDIWCNSYATAPAAGSAYQIESSILTVDTAFSPALDQTSRFVIQTGGIWLFSYQATSMYSAQYYDIAADQWYIKTSNTGPIITTPLDGTIQRFGENGSIWERGTAQGSQTTTTLQDTTKSWVVNQWSGYYLRIRSGTGLNQLLPIVSNTSNTLTWSTPGTAPDSTSQYAIEGFDAGTASSSTSCSGTASGTGSMAGGVLTISSVSGSLKPGMVLSGTGVSAILAFSNGTSSAAVVTVSSTTGIYVGMLMTMVSGTGTLAAGVTTVIQVNSSTTFTVSLAPSVALSGTNSFILGGPVGAGLYTSAAGATSSSTTITVTSTANLCVGMGVVVTAGTGAFVQGTTVTSINSSTSFTVSVTPSVALSGGATIVVGTFPLVTYITGQLSGTSGSDGTYSVFPVQNVSSTTITGTGVATLVDSTKNWSANRWNNMAVRIVSGTGAGQVRSIVGTTPTSLIINRNWMIAPDSSSVYVIHGDVDKILLSVGIASPGTSALFVHNLESDILTLGRALDFGSARGLSAQLLNTGQTYGDTPAIACSGAVYTALSGTISTTAGSVNSDNTVTVTFSATVFAVGSFVTVSGCTPSAYNGTYRVRASFAGSCTYMPSSTPGGVITVNGTISQSASLLVTTVNAHNFITGQRVGIRGDIGTGLTVNNLAAGYEIFANSTTTFTVGLASASASASVPAQGTAKLVDASKNWTPNQWAGCLVTYNTAAVAQATGIAAETAMQIAGNDSNTLYFVAAAAAAPVQGVSRYVITPQAFHPLKNMIGTIDGGLSIQSTGTANSTTQLVDVTKQWTSATTSCSSTGTTLITTSGNTVGLQVGMYVGISAGTGTFVVGAVAGTYTPITVTAVNSNTTFTVSAIPATNLSGATVIATKWYPGAFVNRKLRVIGGTGLNQELTITANTATTITFAAATAPVTGQTTYSIIQAPGKGLGININWNYGQTDTTKRGSYLYLPRGNATVGLDRLNLTTDSWELLHTSPLIETLTTGTMSAYDGADRIYFTKDVTQRVYYYDLDKNTIHVAGMYPYIAGTAITGNRMEIYETADGLKIMWLNRHSGAECFKTLLFY